MLTAIIALVVAIFVVGGVISAMGNSTGKTVISKHDELFELPPGALPPHPGFPTRKATGNDVRAPVAVRFEPPAGVLPEQVGMLSDAAVSGPDIAAAIVGLAVDGYLNLRPQKVAAGWRGRDVKTEWLVTVQRPADDRLTPLRKDLLRLLAILGRPATIAELKPHLAKNMSDLRQDFARQPQFQQWYPHLRGGSIPLGKCLTSPGAKQRSALGTALRYQSAGFKHFLAVADGNALRFQEGAGIFSRYLPWAIAYGVTDQWVRAFGQALHGLDPATADIWVHDLAWYGDFGSFDTGSFDVGSFDGLGDAAGDLVSSLGDALSDLTDSIGDLASDLSDAGGDGGGGDGGGDGGGGGD
ncbi:hypothetical protein AAEX63_14095 [Luteococcus sp. H138]|uniref:hypothetical protein n=1 Tax=unclassified Luteococcus TaxID=2639923 RepID=UPI00313C1EF6